MAKDGLKYVNTKISEELNLKYKMARLLDGDRSAQEALKIGIKLYIEAVDAGRKLDNANLSV